MVYVQSIDTTQHILSNSIAVFKVIMHTIRRKKLISEELYVSLLELSRQNLCYNITKHWFALGILFLLFM